jgi:hypothetical protein
MEEANYGQNEIRSILGKVKIYNKEIGIFQVFAVTENFDYAVKLSNGKILIKIEELQDDERDALTPERLKEIASRFVSSNSTKEQNQSTETIQQPTSNTTTPKPKSKTGIIVVSIIIGLLLISGVVMFLNNPNSIPGVKVEINTPNPIVVTSRADGSKSGLLKERTTVYATVLNQGGEGNILVTFHVYQDGSAFERTKPIHLNSNESQDLEMTFDEVKMLGGNITFDVNSIAQ